MSNLIKLLHDMASLRAQYQRLHQDLLGLSVRRLLVLVRPNARQEIKARFEHLFERQWEMQEEMERLTAEDLTIRRGEDLYQALANFHQALGETLKRLELIHEARSSQAKGGAGKNSQELLIAYDDALQHQRRLGARINDLLADL